MLNKFKEKIKKNVEIFTLLLVIFITTITTYYFNYFKQDVIRNNQNNLIDNIYLKKTLNHFINNLEPKYQKFHHKIKSGETFDKILKNYSIDIQEITIIKKNLEKKVNLNKLNTKQSLHFSLDKTNNKITEFSFQISNKQKVFLKRDIENDKFSEEILSIKLKYSSLV